MLASVNLVFNVLRKKFLIFLFFLFIIPKGFIGPPGVAGNPGPEGERVGFIEYRIHLYSYFMEIYAPTLLNDCIIHGNSMKTY